VNLTTPAQETKDGFRSLRAASDGALLLRAQRYGCTALLIKCSNVRQRMLVKLYELCVCLSKVSLNV
jgi:hypothetical protein